MGHPVNKNLGSHAYIIFDHLSKNITYPHTNTNSVSVNISKSTARVKTCLILISILTTNSTIFVTLLFSVVFLSSVVHKIVYQRFLGMFIRMVVYVNLCLVVQNSLRLD